jgi:hypothetical protein
MILADFLEYIILGRIYLGLRNDDNKQEFIKAILRFVNILMIYENTTVDIRLRNAFLSELENSIDDISNEELFSELQSHEGKIGLPNLPSDLRALNRYFDTREGKRCTQNTPSHLLF